MPEAIVDLSNRILGNPVKITVKPDKPTADKVDQAVYFVEKQDKIKLLKHLLKINGAESAIVFSRTKNGANKIVKLLDRAGVKAAAIHGNKSQNNRQQTLEAFKNGKLHVLVATDIAARGIDVDNLSMVINYDLPNVPETYVHRIGRTGRAEASGVALSFCAPEERSFLKSIQKLINTTVPVITDHPFVSDEAAETAETPKPHHAYQVEEKRESKRKSRHRSRRRSRNRGQNRKAQVIKG
jgi:ATP-dependent RNA helicase RhlE